MKDEQQRSCACMSIDACECINVRYHGSAYPENEFGEPRERGYNERCGCVCHLEDEDDDVDW